MTTPAPAANPKLKRRWLRFSLRTFLLLTVIIGLGSGWLGSVLSRLQHQRRIVKQVQAGGGHVEYDYQVTEDPDLQHPPGPWLVRCLLGDDAFAYVESVHFGHNSTADQFELLSELPRLSDVWIFGATIDKATLGHVARVPKLRSLHLDAVVISSSLDDLRIAQDLEALVLYRAHFEEAALTRLPELPKLQRLCLSQTNLTSQGLEFVARMPQLVEFDIEDAIGVDDSGLVHLANATQLTQLGLAGTSITDNGLQQLRRLTKLDHLDLSGTAVTDAGLQHLMGFPNLSSLYLGANMGNETLKRLGEFPELQNLVLESPLSDEGMKSIAQLKTLRFLVIKNTTVTDEGLLELKSLSELELVRIVGKITPAGAKKLREHLPNCRIESGPNPFPPWAFVVP